MSTSGVAYTGLGWPSDGPPGEDEPSAGLGWPDPRSDPGVDTEHEADEVPAPHGDDAPPADAVSRETDDMGGADHLSERDQPAAAVPEPGAPASPGDDAPSAAAVSRETDGMGDAECLSERDQPAASV